MSLDELDELAILLHATRDAGDILRIVAFLRSEGKSQHPTATPDPCAAPTATQRPLGGR